jgi:exonuclease VII small subunit
MKSQKNTKTSKFEAKLQELVYAVEHETLERASSLYSVKILRNCQDRIKLIKQELTEMYINAEETN